VSGVDTPCKSAARATDRVSTIMAARINPRRLDPTCVSLRIPTFNLSTIDDLQRRLSGPVSLPNQ
jgi:hypothetical protein